MLCYDLGHHVLFYITTSLQPNPLHQILYSANKIYVTLVKVHFAAICMQISGTLIVYYRPSITLISLFSPLVANQTVVRLSRWSIFSNLPLNGTSIVYYRPQITLIRYIQAYVVFCKDRYYLRRFRTYMYIKFPCHINKGVIIMANHRAQFAATAILCVKIMQALNDLAAITGNIQLHAVCL